MFRRWFRRVTVKGKFQERTEGSSHHTAACTARTALSDPQWSFITTWPSCPEEHETSWQLLVMFSVSGRQMLVHKVVSFNAGKCIIMCRMAHFPTMVVSPFSYCFQGESVQEGSDNGSHFGALCSTPCGIRTRRLLITAARSLEFHSSLSCLFQLLTVQWGNARKYVVVPLVVDGRYILRSASLSALHISALLFVRSLFHWWVETSDWISPQELQHKMMLKLIGHVIHKCCKSAV